MTLDEFLAADERNAKLAPRKKQLAKAMKQPAGWTQYQELMRVAWCLIALERFDEARACARPVLDAEGEDDEGNIVDSFGHEAAGCLGWIAEQVGDSVDEWRERAAKHERDWVYSGEDYAEHRTEISKRKIDWALHTASSVLSELAVRRLCGEDVQERFEDVLELVRVRVA